jgi:hypothetical protein
LPEEQPTPKRRAALDGLDYLLAEVQGDLLIRNEIYNVS